MKKNKKQEQVATLSDKALALLRNGKHQAALESFTRLEELEPEQPDWPRRAAECNRGLGDRGAQIEALGRAAERYVNQNSMAKAVAMFRMILNLDSQHARTQTRLLELQGGRAGGEAAPLALAQAVPERPQRRRLVAPPPAEKPEPPPVVKVDAPPRPSLEQVLRQRRAASPRRPPAEAPAEPPALEREPMVVPLLDSIAVPEPEPIAFAVAEQAPASMTEPAPAPMTKPIAIAEAEPSAAPTPEPIAASADDLGPEPEIVPDELEISSMPAPKPSVPASLPSPLAAQAHTPIPPSDEAVTLRPARFAVDEEAAEPVAPRSQRANAR